MTYQVQKTRIRLLFSTLADATSANAVLLEGERWQEKDAVTGLFTGRTKTGKNGVLSADKTTITGTAFNDLPFDPSGGGASLGDTTPQALGTAAAGTADTASRIDHRHAMPTAAQVGADAAGTAAAAVAAHAAAADPHPSYTTAIEAAAAAPVQSVAGRSGAVTIGVADVSGLGTAATQNVGTSAGNVVQLDGAAKLPAVDGSALTGINTAGTNLTYTAASRLLESSTGADVTLPLATTSDAGLMASTDKTKLDGIANGATANATNEQLRDRATHTGTQAFSTITSTPTTLSGYGITDGFTQANVRATPITNFTSGAGTVAATDTILQAIQKLDGNDAAKIASVTTGVTGAAQVTNIISLSQANYDAIATKNAQTLYIITA